MGNIFQPSTQEKNVLLLGLERAGKTHMLYTYLVGEGGMHTTKKLKDTLGMNYEHAVETPSNFDVWDISGNPLLRKNWSLYIKNIPVSGILYLVNVSEDIERLRESKKMLHRVLNEPALQDAVLVVVYNNKPNLGGVEGKGQIEGQRKVEKWVECPFNVEQLDKVFQMQKFKKKGMTQQSFLVDIGEQKACERVFQFMSQRLDAKSKAKRKRRAKSQDPMSEE